MARVKWTHSAWEALLFNVNYVQVHAWPVFSFLEEKVVGLACHFQKLSFSSSIFLTVTYLGPFGGILLPQVVGYRP